MVLTIDINCMLFVASILFSARLPSRPTQLRVANATINTISLKWQPPAHQARGITGYVLEYRVYLQPGLWQSVSDWLVLLLLVSFTHYTATYLGPLCASDEVLWGRKAHQVGGCRGSGPLFAVRQSQLTVLLCVVNVAPPPHRCLCTALSDWIL